MFRSRGGSRSRVPGKRRYTGRPIGGAASLGFYLEEINRTPLLRREEEYALGWRILAGRDPDTATLRQRHDARLAYDHLVRANLRLAVAMARHYRHSGYPMPDLIQQANLGVMRAATDYDPARGLRFSTYACHWIQQSIIDGLRNQSALIRIPTYLLDALAKWRRAYARLARLLGREPDPEEVAKELGFPRKKLALVRHAVALRKSLVSSDSLRVRGMSLAQLLPVPNARGPESDLCSRENREELHRALEKLPPRERAIVRMRFGLDCERLTLKEIGLRLDPPLTRERVRQLQDESLARLRRALA